jgi:hypothetical protein
MWWLDDEQNNEHGGVAVTVAIMLVVLIGVGALVLDAGNLYWERRQLQNSADAAVLAAAQDIAGAEDAAAEQTARDFAMANNVRGAHVESFDYDPAASTVTVVTRTGDEDSAGFLASWLAGVLGHDEYFARAEATALIAGAKGGAAFPVIISYCEWEAFLNNPEEFGEPGFEPDFKEEFQTIYLLDPHDATGDCTGPSGHQAPGGWGWLDPDSGECSAYIDEEGWVDGNTGSTSPSPADQTGCTQEYFDDLVESDEPVLVPIFEETNDLSGDNHAFRIMGFAAFEIEGYRIRGSWASDPAPCSNPDRCFRGRFTEYVSLAQYQEGDYATYDLGAREIYLIG